MSNRAVPVLVTHKQLQAAFPRIDAIYVPLLNETMAKFGITTHKRIAAFVAQSGHECANFMRFIENLNYSAEGLHRVFRKYFPTLAAAQPYHRNPQRIANKVYANRMGNGDTSSGDGWTYRGRGAIQLTGKSNYMAFAKDMGMTLSEAVRFLETPRGQIMSAGWFWNKNKLNAYADAGDIRGMTKRINGGEIGLAHRAKLYEKLLTVLR